jgi:hypothetical protein
MLGKWSRKSLEFSYIKVYMKKRSLLIQTFCHQLVLGKREQTF